MKLTTKDKLIGGGYVVFIFLFFFFGMPKVSFPVGLIGFLLVTGLYALIVWFVKKFLIG